jgi:hypothetical protein
LGRINKIRIIEVVVGDLGKKRKSEGISQENRRIDLKRK